MCSALRASWRATNLPSYPNTWLGPHMGATYYNDLLPLPYNETSLDYVCAHIAQVAGRFAPTHFA